MMSISNILFALLVLLALLVNAEAQQTSSAQLLSRLREQHAQLKNSVAFSAVETEAKVDVVRHKAIPDPDAYDKLERSVMKKKKVQQQKVEKKRRIFRERASLRKGGLNEVQEFLPNLPPGKGPLGRIWKPIFGTNILKDDETVAVTLVT